MTARLRIGVVALMLGASYSPCFAGETATLRNGFTIHYERRESAGDTTRLYLTEAADSFVDVPSDDITEVEADKGPAKTPATQPPSVVHHPVHLDKALSAASRKNNVSPELLRSIVRVESGFNPNARSPKGAQGLMQLMPTTAARMGVTNAWNPEQNLDGGARYLRELLGKYNNNLAYALAAYNAGPERVEKYRGVPPFPETVSYVTRVLHELHVAEHQRAAQPPIDRDKLPAARRRSSAPHLDAIRESQAAILIADERDLNDSEQQSSEPSDSN
jgi:Transglycosylase SLT domain